MRVERSRHRRSGLTAELSAAGQLLLSWLRSPETHNLREVDDQLETQKHCRQIWAVRAAWRASRLGLLMVFILGIFINILKFATPFYLLHVLDRVPASRSVETLVMLTVAATLALLTGLALDGVRRRMLARWGIWIEQRFGARLLNRSLNETPSARSSAARQSL